ncbi:MAG: hypothetical protein PV340_02785 [Wolbachia sp.]|nr:hypothetical protein [Wolbachia sp.]MDD9336395.1 hypothetical protein [Wolbachia sp.]
MTTISIPKVKNPKFLELPTQATIADKKILRRCGVIYQAFKDVLLLCRDSDQLEQSNKKSLAFTLEKHEDIFNSINQEDIKSLNEKNFSKLLVLAYKRIREEDLFDEKHLKSGKIKQIVSECVAKIRGKEAWGLVTDFVKFKVPVRGLLKKVPCIGNFLGDEEEEKKKKSQMNDTEEVVGVLHKFLLPIVTFIAVTAVVALISGPTGPVMLSLGIVVVVEIMAIKSLFSNNREGSMHNLPENIPMYSTSVDIGRTLNRIESDQATKKEEKNQKKQTEWRGKIIEDIDKVLKTSIKVAEEGKQFSKVVQPNEQTGKKPNGQLTQVESSVPCGKDWGEKVQDRRSSVSHSEYQKTLK